MWDNNFEMMEAGFIEVKEVRIIGKYQLIVTL